MNVDDPRLRAFADLLAVIDRLRDPDGCPWDRAQGLASIAPCLLEEAHEVADALARGGRAEVAGELGDLLMNILLLGRIAEDAEEFTLEDVCRAIEDKLIRRHPHVFGDVEVKGVQNVLKNWEAIKQQERVGDADESSLAGVPVSLPALLRAQRMGEKAAKVGFEWKNVDGALAKLDEEVAELKTAILELDPRAVDEELGDVLFSVVNVARHVGVDAETALRRTGARFEDRFRHIERTTGQGLRALSAEALEVAWRAAKDAVLPGSELLPPSLVMDEVPAEWRRELRGLATARADLLDAVQDLPPDLAAAFPDPEVSKWSVAAVLEHLSRAEGKVVKGLAWTLTTAEGAGVPVFPASGLAARPPANPLRPPAGPIPAPPGLEGEWVFSKNDAVKALSETRRDLLALLPRAIRLDPRVVTMPHPVLGDIDLLQWFEFSWRHERRHLAQVRKIVQSLS